MAGRAKLYRLLRDDENPLEDGITAKNPFSTETPLKHIRHGSRQTSQWISTSRHLSDVDKFIKLKRKKEGKCATCRVVEIDMLMLYEKKLRNETNTIMETKREISWDMDIFLRPSINQATGQILDFTDQSIMDKHMPLNPFKPRENERARCFARKYSEVLVERFIPADCCIAVYNR